MEECEMTLQYSWYSPEGVETKYYAFGADRLTGASRVAHAPKRFCRLTRSRGT